MKILIYLLTLPILLGCSGDSPGTIQSDKSSPSNKIPNTQDAILPYFSDQGHQIRTLKKFEYGWSSAHFRGLSFNNGRILQTNEKTGDGRGCTILQSDEVSDLGPVLPQALRNVVPITRESIGDEISDDMRFAGIKFDYTIVANGILYCYRHESLGPVTLQDFRDHFAGYIEFSE